MGQLLYIDDDGVNHWIPQKGNKDGEALVEIKGFELDVGDIVVDVSTLATQATLLQVLESIGEKGEGDDLLTVLNSLIDNGALKITTDGITVSGDFATQATLNSLVETINGLITDDKLNVNSDMELPEGLATEETLSNMNDEITDLNSDIGMRVLERFDETDLVDGLYTLVNELNGIVGIEVTNNSIVNSITFDFGGQTITVNHDDTYKDVLISADTSILIIGENPNFDFIIKVPITATNEKLEEVKDEIAETSNNIETMVALAQPLVIQDTFTEGDLISGFESQSPETAVDVYGLNPNDFRLEYFGIGIRNNGSSAEMQMNIMNLSIAIPPEGSFHGLFSTRDVTQIEFPTYTEFDAYLEGAYGDAPEE